LKTFWLVDEFVSGGGGGGGGGDGEGGRNWRWNSGGEITLNIRCSAQEATRVSLKNALLRPMLL
jgi:hypothetical protein